MNAGLANAEKAIRLANSLVDTAALFALMLLLVAGCYALWDSEQVYREASSANYATYKPAEDPLSFEELKALNPDVFAWITVYGVHIDYPVTQGADNMTYVNKNAKGEYSLSGAIFLDSANKRDFSDFPSILYGHHMEKNAMFGEIGRFADRDFFEERAYGALYFDGKEHGLEFFAFLHADAYDGEIFRTGLESREAKEAYLGLLLRRAEHTRDIGITAEDRIVLLSTCSSSAVTNERDILVGRITDESFEDTFKTSQKADGAGIVLAVDGIVSLWSLIPPWARPLLPALLPLAAALALRRARPGRKR
jgi:sortase B